MIEVEHALNVPTYHQRIIKCFSFKTRLITDYIIIVKISEVMNFCKIMLQATSTARMYHVLNLHQFTKLQIA